MGSSAKGNHIFHTLSCFCHCRCVWTWLCFVMKSNRLDYTLKHLNSGITHSWYPCLCMSNKVKYRVTHRPGQGWARPPSLSCGTASSPRRGSSSRPPCRRRLWSGSRRGGWACCCGCCSCRCRSAGSGEDPWRPSERRSLCSGSWLRWRSAERGDR